MSLETRLAVDIGGTFTDIVLDVANRRHTKKVLTTPSAPERGLMTGAKALLAEAGLRFADVDIFVHGTTLATNAILERRGARTALLTTQGFRDVLEIGAESRFDQYDLQIELPKPLIPRALRFGIDERIDAAGSVLRPVDKSQLAAVIDNLARLEVESVAVSFLHGYLNPEHEQFVAEELRKQLPKVWITLANEACPQIREYERTSTAAANAYVQPQMDSYLEKMSEALAAESFGGSLYLITSSGGLTTIDAARRFPVRLVESGPAGGALFASSLARNMYEPHVVSFDMGGTTAKLCLIGQFEPTRGRLFEVDRTKRFKKGSGLPICIPVIEMVEVGAGGGSIAAIDSMQRITVGPASAGSEPGPACFGRGGVEPTVTDADLVLGLLDPSSFAGGTLRLDRLLAAKALEEAVGQRSELAVDYSAHAVYEIVCENMAAAARAHAAEQGQSLSTFTMIAFGGAAPLHAARVAEKLGVPKVVIPPDAGVGSAVGFLAAPIAYEVVHSMHMRADAFDPAKVNALLDAMSTHAAGVVGPALGERQAMERRTAHIRYVGQNNELEIELPLRALGPSDAGALSQAFEQSYAKQFSRAIPGAALEFVNWSVRVAGADYANATEFTLGRKDRIPSTTSSRDIFDPALRVWLKVPEYGRAELGADFHIDGPALIVEKDTTTFISSAFNAHVDGRGCIVMTRKSICELSHG